MRTICLMLLVLAVLSFPDGLSAQGPYETGIGFDGKDARQDDVFSAEYDSQLPARPGTFDAPAAARCRPALNPMTVKWIEPSGGVNADTGLLILLYGINASVDCTLPFFGPEQAWVDQRNLVVAVPLYRNLSFFAPYDFGKYQVVDVLRATGAMLERYPSINRKRLYLIGGSGGGHLGLQVLQLTPELWAEVHIHKAITKITVPEDVLSGGFEEDPPQGWNVNLRYPTEQGNLDDQTWRHYRAERTLRSPAAHAAIEPRTGPNAPRVYMFHGDADPTVDYQHFLHYRSMLETGTGQEAREDEPGVWNLANWTFMRLDGEDHIYDNFAVSSTRVAEAFSRERAGVPPGVVAASLPIHDGWTYIYTGELGEVRVDTIQTQAAQVAWTLY